MSKKRRALRAIDLFAGAGGTTAGAMAAGVRVIAAVDYWGRAKDVYTANFPGVRFYHERCEDLSVASMKRALGEIDLLLASPECTSHTCAKGSAKRSEISRRTAFEVVRFAGLFKPRWILVENVVHMRSWRRYASWLQAIKALGYRVREQVIDATDHGVPQARRRLFIMCDRKREPPAVLPSVRKRKTAAAILSSNGDYSFSPLRTERRAKPTLQRANRALREVGPNRRFLIVYYGSDAAGGWQKVNAPLRTVTTLDRFALVKPSKQGHVMRMLQVPEIKAAMGFPKRFALNGGTRRDSIKLLGNAVCPPVITSIIKHLTGPTSRARKPRNRVHAS